MRRFFSESVCSPVDHASAGKPVLLYAIHHEETEAELSARLSKRVRIAGSALYQEAVMQKLGRTGADTLLLLEHLPGPEPFLTFLEELRITYPKVRIIVLLKERPKGSPFVKEIIDLGIYDLFLKNPNLSELEDCLFHPHTFQDVQAFRNPTDPDCEDACEGELLLPGGRSSVETGTDAKKEGEKADGTLLSFQPEKSSTGWIGALFRKETKEKNKPKEKAKPNKNSDRTGGKQEQTGRKGLFRRKRKPKGEDVQEQKDETTDATKELPFGEKGAETASEEDEGRKDERKDAGEEKNAHLKKEESFSMEQRNIEVYRNSLSKSFQQAFYEEAELRKEAEDALRRLKEEQQLQYEALEGECSELREQVKLYQVREEKQECLRREREAKLLEQEAEIARLGKRKVDCSMEYPPLGPYEADLFFKEGITLFTGLAGGVGTTTMALNEAVAFAEAGEKTILLELGNPSPLLVPYFNLSRVSYGFFEALDALKREDPDALGRAVIRPRKLIPKSRSLFEAYRKLPEGLHLMVYSAGTLDGTLFHREQEVGGEDFLQLKRMLENRYGYSRILLDINICSPLWETVLSSQIPVTGITAVLKQDTRSLHAASRLIRNLAKRPEGRRKVQFLLNGYDGSLAFDAKKIRKTLHLQKEELLLFPEDRAGFLSAENRQVPYLCNGGTYSTELRSLVQMMDRKTERRQL